MLWLACTVHAEGLNPDLCRHGQSTLRVHGWVTTDRVAQDGSLVIDRHAVVTLALQGIMDLQLDGFSRQNVIFGLLLRRAPERPERRRCLAADPLPEDIEIELVPCYGLDGHIRARSVAITFEPGKPGERDA